MRYAAATQHLESGPWSTMHIASIIVVAVKISSVSRSTKRCVQSFVWHLTHPICHGSCRCFTAVVDVSCSNTISSLMRNLIWWREWYSTWESILLRRHSMYKRTIYHKTQVTKRIGQVTHTDTYKTVRLSYQTLIHRRQLHETKATN